MKNSYFYHLLRLFYILLIAFVKQIKNKPIKNYDFGASTLDFTDVKIARKYLKNKSNNNFEIEKFEQSFAEYNKSEFAFSFMAGRIALSAIVKALQLKEEDEVIIPAFTCVVVPNAFIFENIKIRYSDIELDSYGLDFEQLKKNISPKTKLIVVQHLFGLVNRDFEKILNLAEEKNIFVIEDCSHSLGAEFKSKKVGNFGIAAIYSFENSKIISTFKGGVATTNNNELAKKISDIQSKMAFPSSHETTIHLKNLIFKYYTQKHQLKWLIKDFLAYRYSKYLCQTTSKLELEGIKPPNYYQKMPEAVAILACNQLKKVDIHNQNRRKAAKRWNKWCEENNFKKPLIINNSVPVFLRYPIIVSPEMKKNHLWARKLETEVGLWYVSNIHPIAAKMPKFKNANIAVSQCVNFITNF